MNYDVYLSFQFVARKASEGYQAIAGNILTNCREPWLCTNMKKGLGVMHCIDSSSHISRISNFEEIK